MRGLAEKAPASTIKRAPAAFRGAAADCPHSGPRGRAILAGLVAAALLVPLLMLETWLLWPLAFATAVSGVFFAVSSLISRGRRGQGR